MKLALSTTFSGIDAEVLDDDLLHALGDIAHVTFLSLFTHPADVTIAGCPSSRTS